MSEDDIFAGLRKTGVATNFWFYDVFRVALTSKSHTRTLQYCSHHQSFQTLSLVSNSSQGMMLMPRLKGTCFVPIPFARSHFLCQELCILLKLRLLGWYE